MTLQLTITNAYGAHNIGDEAIQANALQILDDICTAQQRRAHIVVLCEDPEIFPHYRLKSCSVEALYSPYGFILHSFTFIPLVIRKLILFPLIVLLSYTFALLAHYAPKLKPGGPFLSYISALRDSSVVLGMGGGYFTSKHPVLDYYGLILTVIPLHIAKLFGKKMIHLPISFGPFAVPAHAQLTSAALAHTTVIPRDDISQQVLASTNGGQSIQQYRFPDTATFAKDLTTSDYWVLTVRDWLPASEQRAYEKKLAALIDQLWAEKQLSVVLVVMAQNKLEDDDRDIFMRIQRQLVHPEATAQYVPARYQQVQRIIKSAQFAVCTRMHSAILALTVGTPFLTIGYGHKGLGFMESVGLADWYIDIAQVKSSAFEALVQRCLTQTRSKELRRTLALAREENAKQKGAFISQLTNMIDRTH